MRNFIGWLVFVMLLLPARAGAQQDSMPRSTTSGPPIQRIATASAVSTERIGNIIGVRELPDGRVLVNDGMRRRLLLMDTSMKTVGVVLDSLSDVSNTYGTRPGALIPFRGDTTLFVDPASFAVVVLDPEGKMVRVRSVWRVEDIPFFTNTSGSFGWPGVDGKGRIVYRVAARPAPPRVRPPAGVPYIPAEPDSAFVVAMDIDTRKADTLGSIRIPRRDIRLRRTTEGMIMFDQVVFPLPTTDEWAVLPDGTTAFLRWRDYRIEYLQPDGTIKSSAKLPFDWQRLTDNDKQRIVDSVRVAQQKQSQTQYITAMIRWVNMYGRGYPQGFEVPEGYTPPPGFAKDWMLPPGVKFPERYMYACAPGVEPESTPPAPSGPTPPGMPSGMPAMPSCVPAPIISTGGMVPPAPTPRSVLVASPSDLPDFKPPFGTGAMVPDRDGNLWIRTIPAKPIPGGPVYDVINPQGELESRMQLPPGYTIVGFGKNKVVYLSMRDATGIHLARVRLR